MSTVSPTLIPQSSMPTVTPQRVTSLQHSVPMRIVSLPGFENYFSNNLLQIHFFRRPPSFRITLLVQKLSHLSPFCLITPIHSRRTLTLLLPHHQILTTRILSAFFSGIQGDFRHPVVSNSVLFFPPIGTICCFSRRLISPALGTLKFLSTPSFELIAPSPAGTQPLLETKMVGEFLF